jgi:hypothetical protein
VTPPPDLPTPGPPASEGSTSGASPGGAPGGATPGRGPGRLRRAARIAREALWGLFVYELHHETVAQRRQLEQATNLLLLGEFLGLPLMSAPVTLRVLPYLVGDLARFKESASEEWDFIEHAPHLH